MDQYFVQMDKIIRTKKISSRIKFAIVDVIDLRKAGWKSRKNDDNPKTIDQIHKEAAQEEKDAMARVKQNEMKQRLDPQQGRRGKMPFYLHILYLYDHHYILSPLLS